MPNRPVTPQSLGVLSIATNIYLDYWMELAGSIDKHVRAFESVTLHVFTDQPDDAMAFADKLENVRVDVHEIEPLGWPEATLFRFRIIQEHQQLLTEQYLMYLDADSMVDADFESDLADRMNQHGVLLVEQSGSWRPPKLLNKLRFYTLLHPGAILADIRKLVWEGGLGTWEKNRRSQAFVPRGIRKSYVYGAVWMGTREKLLDMVLELSDRIQRDWDQGIIAKWHDESHVNWWNSEYKPQLLDPRYYFFPGHRHLEELPCIIRLVHKREKTR